MPVVNIPIKILGQPHSHSRSNSSSSIDNERLQQQQQQQQQPNQNQNSNQQSGNMNNGGGFPSNFSSRSPLPDFGSDFPNFPSSFANDPEWRREFPSFPNFPNSFSSNNPNAGSNNDFPFGRDGGLSPNPSSIFANLRRSPTPTHHQTSSPSATLRRNSNQMGSQPNIAQQQQQQQQQRQTTPPNQSNQNNLSTPAATNSRPPSRANREPKEVEVPERPAIIPLPYEKTKKDKENEAKNLEENIAKITIGKTECQLCPDETDGDPSPLTSPADGKPKRSKKLQRNQSVVDFNAKTIVQLDNIEVQVEQLRRKAAELELEKDQILRSLGEISVHNCMLKLADCDREEIEAITDRLTKRTKTVQVVVETPRNEEQKKALEIVNSMIDDANGLMNTNIEKAKMCIQTYLNACSSEETTGATCQNFLKVIIQCTADDQKRAKRRLENLMSQIENAEKATAELIEDEESE